MGLFEELLPASFRGVRFLVDATTIGGGRKTVTHEFVGSDKRFVEDLGLLNKAITISAVISGDDYISRRANLIAAMETPGEGELVLPIDGTKTVTPKPYTLVEQFTELGEARFELTFEVSQPPILPKEAGANISVISDLVDQSINRLEDSFGASFEATTGNNLLSAASILEDLSDEFDKVTAEFVKDDQFINDFFADFVVFKESIFELTQKPTELASQIQVLFSRLEDVAAADPDKAKTVFEVFYSFGDDREELDIDTFEIIQRNKNAQVIDEYVQSLPLVINYRNLSNTDFLTTEQIDTEKTTIDEQYVKITQNTILNNNDQTELNETRNLIMQFLEDQSQNAFSLTDIKVKTIPATVLTYQHYGNLDNVQNIIDINEIKDVSFVEGDIKILTK